MKILFFTAVLFLMGGAVYAQRRLSEHEIALNFFRNPSIGVEYRFRSLSFHTGYYLTNFERDQTTRFLRLGIAWWFLPVVMPLSKNQHSSSFYFSLSYARGKNRSYTQKDAFIGELGFRWMLWKGINVRLGVAGLTAKNERFKINPTPGISYSFFF